MSWCGEVTQPDIIAEIADFFIRFDQVDWALAIGQFEGQLKLSLRAAGLGGRAGETLRMVVDGLGNAGGHDKRAGGMITLNSDPAPSIRFCGPCGVDCLRNSRSTSIVDDVYSMDAP